MLEDSKHDTSGNYLHLLPHLSAREVRFIDSPTVRSQFASLERHLPPSGHEMIRKPQSASAHDDVATSVAGALVAAGDRLAYIRDYTKWAD